MVGTNSVVRRSELVIENPAAFHHRAFRDALAAQGITVSGSCAWARPGPCGEDHCPALTAARPADLRDDRESINHYAEADLPEHGAHQTDLPKARRPRGGHAARLMVPAGGQTPTPCTPRRQRAVHSRPGDGPARCCSFSRSHRHLGRRVSCVAAGAGESELRPRMRSTARRESPRKTGTTNSVISLGGYVTAQSGEVVVLRVHYMGRIAGTRANDGMRWV